MRLDQQRMNQRIRQEEEIMKNWRSTPLVNQTSISMRTRNPLERIEDKLIREGANREKRLENIRIKEENERLVVSKTLGKIENKHNLNHRPPKPKNQK